MAKLRTHVFPIGILAVISALLLFTLLFLQYRFGRLRNDIQLANDLGWTFDRDRELACKGDVTNAASILWKLHFPGLDWPDAPRPFEGALGQIVERQRKAAVQSVIECLKAKSGENLGDSPERWILKFGAEEVRGQLKEMERIRKNN